MTKLLINLRNIRRRIANTRENPTKIVKTDLKDLREKRKITKATTRKVKERIAEVNTRNPIDLTDLTDPIDLKDLMMKEDLLTIRKTRRDSMKKDKVNTAKKVMTTSLKI